MTSTRSLQTWVIVLIGISLRAEGLAQPTQSEFKDALLRTKTIDGPILAGSDSDEKTVEDYVASSWRILLKELQNLPPGSEDKIFAAAMDALNDEEYLDFVVESFSLYNQGQITEENIHLLIMPNDSKAGFLAVNYRDQQLAKILSQIQPRLKEHSYASFVTDILTGKANLDHEKFQKGTGQPLRKSVEEARKNHRDPSQLPMNSRKTTPLEQPSKTELANSEKNSTLKFLILFLSIVIAFGLYRYFISKRIRG